MANHPSALKRHRQSEKSRIANRSVRAKLRTLIRQLRETISTGDRDAASAKLNEVSRQLAKAATKGVLHSSTASRQTGRLARQVSSLGK
ncbi:MAG TPA: 30S ribosomal protein S20 [Candidatus Limnocylindrales bacterium]|nr:30S ribosomal protein S20 [Candidatus Limnocylindrales bacterium]